MTDDRMPWFTCYPAKWLVALAGMKPDDGYLYLIVCLRIYEAGRACPDTLESLARRSGMNKRRASDALDRLFKSGKLVRQPDGIMNPFAASVIADAVAFRERRVRAGQKGGLRSAEIRQQNQLDQPSDAMVLPLANSSHLQLQEHRQKEVRVEPRAKRRAPRAIMLENWRPDEKGIEYARMLGLESQVERLIRGCVNYHLKHGTLIAGANGLAATWRTWCDNEVKFTAERAARTKGTGGPTMFDIASGNFKLGEDR